MESFDFLFDPQSVAVVGSLRGIDSPAVRYLRQYKNAGFKGKLYAVSRKSTEHIEGVCPCHQSLKDIPGPVDYVIACVPATVLMDLADECIDKQVKAVHIFTGRLRETSDPQLERLEQDIVRRLRACGIRVVGPNCMGIYRPESGMTFRFEFPRETGPVAFLSQSAGNAGHLAGLGIGRGLRFSKIISYGNGTDLNETDFLEYLTDDAETKIISLYIEGVRDGRRFLKALARAAAKKPVVVMKGGRSEAGARAATSHTASLAGSQLSWDVALRQVGAIQVESIEEMADLLLALMFLPPAQGKRAAVLCGGGGDTVSSADQCEAHGLVVPALSQDLREEFQRQLPEVGSLVNNPVDYSALGDQAAFDLTSKLLARHRDFDVVVCDTQVVWRLGYHNGLDRIAAMVDTFIKVEKSSLKPVVVAIHLPDFIESAAWSALIDQQARCWRAGLAVYPSLERAIKALAGFIYYHDVVRGG